MGRSTWARPCITSAGRGRSIAGTASGASVACRYISEAANGVFRPVSPSGASIAALRVSSCVAAIGTTGAPNRDCGPTPVGIAVGRSEHHP